MMRRTRKSTSKHIGMAPADVEAPSFSISEAEWQKLEDACGAKFGNADRATIANIVDDYFLNRTIEQSAATVQECIEWVQEFEKGAALLHDRMRNHLRTNDARKRCGIMWAQMHIVLEHRKLADIRLQSWGQAMNLLSSLREAAANARDVIESDRPGFEDGCAWQKLVDDLKQFASARGWSPAAWASEADSSRLVSLLRSLQELFPEGFSKYNASEQGLAKKINRDRRTRN